MSAKKHAIRIGAENRWQEGIFLGFFGVALCILGLGCVGEGCNRYLLLDVVGVMGSFMLKVGFSCLAFDSADVVIRARYVNSRDFFHVLRFFFGIIGRGVWAS